MFTVDKASSLGQLPSAKLSQLEMSTARVPVKFPVVSLESTPSLKATAPQSICHARHVQDSLSSTEHGSGVGTAVGDIVGIALGTPVGLAVGLNVGFAVGGSVGCAVGYVVGI